MNVRASMRNPMDFPWAFAAATITSNSFYVLFAVMCVIANGSFTKPIILFNFPNDATIYGIYNMLIKLS